MRVIPFLEQFQDCLKMHVCIRHKTYQRQKQIPEELGNERVKSSLTLTKMCKMM